MESLCASEAKISNLRDTILGTTPCRTAPPIPGGARHWRAGSRKNLLTLTIQRKEGPYDRTAENSLPLHSRVGALVDRPARCVDTCFRGRPRPHPSQRQCQDGAQCPGDEPDALDRELRHLWTAVLVSCGWRRLCAAPVRV